MTERFDVAVIGGGPAGTSVAIALARSGRSVVVFERSRYEAVRVGETLPPRVREPLVKLGVWEQFRAGGHVPSYGVASAWGDPECQASQFLISPYGNGWHVERRRFDPMLAEAAQAAGATVYRSARVRTCAQGNRCGWGIEAQVGATRFRVEADFAIDASGRAAWLARRQGARRVACDRLVGVVGYFTVGRSARDDDGYALVEAGESGWWYSALLPDHRLVAAFMTDADLYPRWGGLTPFWRERLSDTSWTRNRLEGCVQASHLRMVAANAYHMDRVGGPGWLAVGDAASAFDPLSSQGLLGALETGLEAAQAVIACQRGDATALAKYDDQRRHGWLEYLREHAWYYYLETRWPESLFWFRRHHYMPARNQGPGR